MTHNNDIGHKCTEKTCPPTGGYYVSAIDAGTTYLMAGPYNTHEAALADVDKALRIADDIDGRAWFMGWGTIRMRNDYRIPGKLNELNLMVP